ncbi:MAG: CoA transferase [Dehalococcoidia bacterium]
MSSWAAERTREDAVAALRAARLPAGPVNDARDLLTDFPHLNARGFIQMVDHDPRTGVGRRPLPGQPWRLSRTPVHVRRPAPPLGEGNEHFFKGVLGMPADRFDALVTARVTGELEPFAEEQPVVSAAEHVRMGRLFAYDPDYRQRLGLDAAAVDGADARQNTATTT